MNSGMATEMDVAQNVGRVEIDRRALADLMYLASQAAHSLRAAEAPLSDALSGSVAEIQFELATSC